MTRDALAHLLVILGMIGGLLLTSLLSEAEGREKGRRDLCPELLAEQTTKADSVRVAARWPECEWWGADPTRGAFR